MVAAPAAQKASVAEEQGEKHKFAGRGSGGGTGSAFTTPQKAPGSSEVSGDGLYRSPSMQERLARVMTDEKAEETEAKAALAAAYEAASAHDDKPSPTHSEQAAAAATNAAWEAHTDEEGNLFYYETVSGHSQWERPQGVHVAGDTAVSEEQQGQAQTNLDHATASPNRSSPEMDVYSSDDTDDAGTAGGEEVWQI